MGMSYARSDIVSLSPSVAMLFQLEIIITFGWSEPEIIGTQQQFEEDYKYCNN